MKVSITKIIAVCLLLTAFNQKISAQIEAQRNYIFTGDSLAGFDVQAASSSALSEGFFGDEYNVHMYQMKRAFINAKYQIKAKKQAVTLYNNPVGRPNPSQVGGVCDNEDFELGTTQGWVLQSGSNSNSCQEPSLNASSLYTVYTNPTNDDRLPMQVNSYFDASVPTTPAGSAYIRLNDDKKLAKAVRLTKTFIPTPSSAIFQYAYLAVIEDGSHSCCDQPGFNIKIVVTNTTTNASTVLACPQISIAVPGTSCQFTVPIGGPSFSPCLTTTAGGNWSYCDWTASAIDLVKYIGFQVSIKVTVVDCNAGGHAAYAYFDSKCSPMDIIGNDQSFPAGTTNILLPTCGAQGSTICATPGLGPYSWAGPGVGTNYSTPSFTNSCYIATLSATYTLTMNPPGSCQPIVKVITTTITPAPQVLASVQQALCGNTLAVVNVTPSGSAVNNPSITYTPNYYSSNNATSASFTLPLGPAPQTVTVQVQDPVGCKVTTTVNVLPGAPYPTFTLVNTTGSPSITCNTPSLGFVANSTYTYGTLTYFWSSNSATFNTNPVTITVAGNYTVVIKDPATGCTASDFVSVTINTVAPTLAVTPTIQTINCNFTSIKNVTTTASPTVNVTQSIYSPPGTIFTSQSYTLEYQPSAPGVYTPCVVNDVNGCMTCKSFTVLATEGFPTFSVVSAQNFSLGCGTKSVASINIINGQATNSLQVPTGGPVSYTLLSPSASSVTAPGTLNAVGNYTVNQPGTWTVVTKDNNTFCETRLPISILSNTFVPNLKANVPLQILDCNTKTVLLKASSSTKNVSYNWGFNGNPGNQAGDSISVSTNTTVATTNTLINNFTLTILDNSSTCISTSVIPMYQSLMPPRAVITGSGTLSCITTSIVLTNQSVSQIPGGIGFPVGQPAIGFLWKGPTPQVPQSNSTTYLAKVPGSYTMTAKDLNNGCTSVTTTIIGDNIRYPIINNPVVPPVSILDCGIGATATLTPILTNTTANMSYTWITPPAAATTPATLLTLKTDLAGEYIIVVLDKSSGCTSNAKMDVINGKLTADFEADATSGYAPMTVKFTNKSTSSLGSTSITSIWNFGNGLIAPTPTAAATATAALGGSIISTGLPANASPVTVYTQPGTYTVVLNVAKGTCLEKTSKVITVDIPSELTIPNVFTPNNDGINDVYHLKATNLSEITMTIFDRWGHLVYELTSTTGNISWDGKSQIGTEVAEGTYFYTIKATGKDGVAFDKNGTISVFR